jgi:hypothetical protein
MLESVRGVHAQKWNTHVPQAFFRYRKANVIRLKGLRCKNIEHRILNVE